MKKNAWVAGAVGIVAAMAAGTGASLAQVSLSETDIAQAARRSFDIPPQPLSTALVLFGQQSGRQITADGALLRGVSTPGVQGTMTVDEALQRLLGGTGLVFSGTGGATITLQRPGSGSGAMHLDPVQVQASVPPQAMIDNIPPPYAGGQVATGSQLGLLGNRDVMDTPFNQTSYTAKKAQDQQAQTIRDVLIDDPSVRIGRPTGNNGAQSFMIRGFNVENSDIAFGGLYGLLPTYAIGVELAERIEVLKGPSVMLNGMPPTGAIGGTVNVVPKRAGSEPLNRITAAYTSNAQFGGAIDVARRFGSDEEIGVRVNGAYRAGQTAIQWTADETALVSIGLDYRGDRFRLSADLGYQFQYLNGGVGYANLLPGVAAPGVPTLSRNFILPWTWTTSRDLFGVIRGEVDVAPGITAYAAMGAHDNRWSSLWSGDPQVNNVNGNATQTPLRNNAYESNWSGEVGVRGDFRTGLIDHSFAVSASRMLQQFGFGRGVGTAYASNIYNPNVVAPPSIVPMSPTKSSALTLSSLGLADTLSMADKRLQLTLGARLQQISSQSYNLTSGLQTATYTQGALSPSVALVVRPWKEVSFYGNFIQGLQQGTVVGPTFANAGEVLPPYKSTQFEIGAKIDWGKFTTTLSAFQISQPSAVTNVAANTLSQNGMQRNRGIELNVFGTPMEGVRLLGGAMFLEAILVNTAGGLNDGWQAAGAPNVQLNLAGEWDTPFAPGLTLDGRMIYTGPQFVGLTTPRVSIPDWVRFDVGARYTFENAKSPTGRPVVLRFNVENVLDTNYWSMVNYTTRLNVGTPRTFKLALTTDF